MGVTGLLPFLKKSTDQINISQFAGMAVAIDAYVWLHRGVFSCADKLARGEKTIAYIHYAMKQLHMLLSHNIKPILVFDGQRLEAKSETENKRSEARQRNRIKADELLRAGRTKEALDFQRRSVDVDHLMAVELMKAARKMNVDCIVAPHEADAQLAYLNRQGIVQLVITEDSDLILFGCTQILYKLDINGNGMLLRADRLHLSLGRPHETLESLCTKLRHICILSGCDYVNSLPGVGLAKAKKFVMATTDPDFKKALKRLPSFLNLRSKVDETYLEKFESAETAFLRQLVFDPRTRKQVTVDGQDILDNIPFAGRRLDPDIALQLSLGNLNPRGLHRVDNFDLSKVQPHSIWHLKYSPHKITKPEEKAFSFVTTRGKQVTVQTKNVVVSSRGIDAKEENSLLDHEILALYSTSRSMDTSETTLCDNQDNQIEITECAYFSHQRMCEISSPKFFSVKNKSIEENNTDSLVKHFLPLRRSPRKMHKDEILVKMESLQTKQEISTENNPIAKNPFAVKKSPVKAPPLDFDLYLDEKLRAFEESSLEDIEETPPESFKEESPLKFEEPTSAKNSQSLDISPENNSLLNRFKFRRPLFRKSTSSVGSASDTNVNLETFSPPSPILGKRKRVTQKLSPSKQRVTSSYFSTPSSDTSSPTAVSPTVINASGTSVLIETKRNLTSVFSWTSQSKSLQFSNSQQDEIRSHAIGTRSCSPKISANRTTGSRSIGLKRSSKAIQQTSLLHFGFAKK